MESALNRQQPPKPGLKAQALPRTRVASARLSLLIILLVFLTSRLAGEETDKQLVFILSGNADVYATVADSTEASMRSACARQQISCDGFAFRRYQTGDNLHDTDKEAFVTIALGTRAADWFENQAYEGYRVRAMLPDTGHRQSGAFRNNTLADIYIDQPIDRYYALIQATIPRAKRIGLLIHESDSNRIGSYAESAEQYDFSLRTGIVDDNRNVGEAFSYILNDIDVLLALPDSRIHNGQTISHILTTAYRNDVPVVGFSSAYVKAGAMAAVYTSPEDIARQLADTLLVFLRTGNVHERFQQAKYFSVSINFEVARSLGLPPKSPSEVKQAIARGTEDD